MRVVVLSFVLILCFFTFTMFGYAQPVTFQQFQELQQRVEQVRDEQLRRSERLAGLETRLTIIEGLQLDRRLTKLETISETNRTMLLATISGIIMLLVEAASRLVRTWKNGDGI